MILIQEITNINPADLDTLIENHCNFLNSSTAGVYVKGSIYKRIENKRDYFIANKKKCKSLYAPKNEVLYQEQLSFLNHLIKDDGKYLKTIINGKPLKLQEIIEEIESKFSTTLLSISNREKASLTEFGNLISELFNYPKFRDSELSRRNSKILGFEICVCPYCNIDNLTMVELNNSDSNGNTVRALLYYDHFYPESRYPFLAISFYNIIQSCNSCNSRYKYEKKFDLSTHIHPYVKSFNDYFNFFLFYSNVTLNDEGIPSIKIIDKNGILGTFANNSIVDLELENRYKPYVTQIVNDINILKKNTRSQCESIDTQLFNNNNTMTIEDAYQLAKVPRIKQLIAKYPLGKVKRDICIKIGLFKEL